jgi:hypothetical protein
MVPSSWKTWTNVGDVLCGDVVDYQFVDELLSALCVDVACEGLAP